MWKEKTNDNPRNIKQLNPAKRLSKHPPPDCVADKSITEAEMRDTLIFTLGVLTGATIVYMASFIPVDGYTKETRLRMDELVAQITPLSVADLGAE